MGDRGQVLIEDTGVYLYTHWGASNLIDVVKKAIAKRWRWDDSEYLARIIFCEMINGEEENILNETGFGIGVTKHGDTWRLIKVNCKDKTVTLCDLEEDERVLSFEDFIGD